MITRNDFKEYRNKLGFKNQNDLKAFLSAKDLKADIDYGYIEKLNQRIKEMIFKLNSIVAPCIKNDDIERFIEDNVDNILVKFKERDILPRLNNQGRRCEQVYFSWIRGNIISNYFKKALSLIFNVDQGAIKTIGHDNIEDIESFSRQPSADLEFTHNNKTIRIEVQSGCQGINDIKEHKVREAKRQFDGYQIHSIVMHIDLFNGQVAFVNLSQIDNKDLNWITRPQMEGQMVFNIDQNYFVWRLIDVPPKLADIEECILY